MLNWIYLDASYFSLRWHFSLYGNVLIVHCVLFSHFFTLILCTSLPPQMIQTQIPYSPRLLALLPLHITTAYFIFIT